MMATTPLTLPLYADYVLNIGKHTGDFIFAVVAPALNGYLGLEQAYLVRTTGLEPARAYAQQPLKLSCLPISPRPLINIRLFLKLHLTTLFPLIDSRTLNVYSRSNRSIS